MVEGGAFQIVAIPCYPWLVGTPPTADAPVGVPTNRRQFEMHTLMVDDSKFDLKINN